MAFVRSRVPSPTWAAIHALARNKKTWSLLNSTDKDDVQWLEEFASMVIDNFMRAAPIEAEPTRSYMKFMLSAGLNSDLPKTVLEIIKLDPGSVYER